MLKVFQSWDDGVVDDIRLAELFREHQARASFNLNPGLHRARRGEGWMYEGKEVLRLARDELAAVYEGFEIANHTMTHPDLQSLDPALYEQEIVTARIILQDWFNQPVDGFCYPYGRATQEAQGVIERSGHRFARNAHEFIGVDTSESFRVVDPHCHFTDPDFWALYERARERDGYFFFWGHSYELITEEMWSGLDEKIRRISEDPGADWVTLSDYASGV